MSEPLRAIISRGLRPKPPPPGAQQTISCPVGFDGTIVQQRSVTWVVNGQYWAVGPWQEVQNNCIPQEVRFTGPNVRPTRGFTDWDEELDPEGQTRRATGTYGWYSISNSGYTCTFRTVFTSANNRFVPWNGRGTMDADISIPGAGGRRCRLFWDRDYATFSEIRLDANGNGSYRGVYSDDGAENPTYHWVMLYGP